MKKRIMAVLIATLVLLGGGCSLFEKKTPITVSDFEAYALNDGYSVEEPDYETLNIEALTKALYARKDNYLIEFYELDSSSNAELVWLTLKEHTEKLASVKKTVNAGGRNLFEGSSSDAYTVVSQIGNTVIAARADKQYKDDVVTLLTKMGYIGNDKEEVPTVKPSTIETETPTPVPTLTPTPIPTQTPTPVPAETTDASDAFADFATYEEALEFLNGLDADERVKYIGNYFSFSTNDFTKDYVCGLEFDESQWKVSQRESDIFLEGRKNTPVYGVTAVLGSSYCTNKDEILEYFERMDSIYESVYGELPTREETVVTDEAEENYWYVNVAYEKYENVWSVYSTSPSSYYLFDVTVYDSTKTLTIDDIAQGFCWVYE